ncbi:MAG: hypothetical protein IPP40_07450 [bacterium]|nr:hypothetical protein [bacterium]
MINYQGSLTTSTGTPLDTTVSMTFHLYDGSGGEAELLWSEVQPVVVVENGLFNSVLGSVTTLEDNVLQSTELWLGIAVGGDPEMMPRTKIQSVPYARHAGTVDQSSGGTITGNLVVEGSVNIGFFNEVSDSRICGWCL